MKKLLPLVALSLFLFHSFTVAADTENSLEAKFCKGFIEQKAQKKESEEKQKETQKKVKTLSPVHLYELVFKFIFAPGSLVHLEETSLTAAETIELPLNSSSSHSQKIAILTFKNSKLSETEKTELAQIKSDLKHFQKDFKKTELGKALTTVETEDACVSALKTHPETLQEALTLETRYNASLPLRQKKREEKTLHLAKKKAQSLQRNGFQVIFVSTFAEAAATVIEAKKSDVLIVSHSTSEGQLVDAELGFFPKDFFKALAPFTSHFAIYACHADKISEFYALKELSQTLPVYLPSVTERFQFLYGETIPLVALSSAKSLFQKPAIYTEAKQNCQILIQSQELPSHAFSVYSGHRFLGALSRTQPKTQLPFDCSEVESIKEIQIFSESKEKCGNAPRLEKIQLHVLEKDAAPRTARLNSFASKTTGEHIVTKAQF